LKIVIEVRSSRYFVIGGLTGDETECEIKRFENACKSIGEALRDLDQSLIICSPYPDSADYWVFSGFTQGSPKDNSAIEIHFVDKLTIRTEVTNLALCSKSFTIVKIPHPPPGNDKKESLIYAWLLCQLQALESCQAIIAIGGKTNGAANMLLLLAEAKRKPIIPFSFMGGAADQSFQRKRYELEDRLGPKYVFLHDEKSIRRALELSETRFEPKAVRKSTINPPNFFISYPRARSSEADYIEILLRSHNIQVFRDKSDFGAGYDIPTQIKEAIYAADVFIAVYCTEYACSPWCYDELELALDRHGSGKLKLWIIRIDDTRVVPTRARSLLNYYVRTRDEIEGRILNLLEHELGI